MPFANSTKTNYSPPVKGNPPWARLPGLQCLAFKPEKRRALGRDKEEVMMTDITNKKEYEQIAFEELTQLRAGIKASAKNDTNLRLLVESLEKLNQTYHDGKEKAEASLSDYKGMLADAEGAVADLMIVNDKAEADLKVMKRKLFDKGLTNNADVAAAKRLTASLAVAEEKYNDLIMIVSEKTPNETRHQTAKRYLVERENRSQECKPQQTIKAIEEK